MHAALRHAQLVLLAVSPLASGGAPPQKHPLDPRGAVHVPIGLPNTLDTLKTFVEPEGCFSPGVASYGVYVWVFDKASGRLVSPTMPDVPCERGLAGQGWLVPWSQWNVGDVEVRLEVCQVRAASPEGDTFVVGARTTLTNRGNAERSLAVYVALRPLGPAGWHVRALEARDGALLVDGHAAIVPDRAPSSAGVLPTDTIGDLALAGRMPSDTTASSDAGNCSGALRFDLSLALGKTERLGFVCPVLPGRRAARHQWDGVSEWAQFDLSKPNPAEGGLLQPDPGLAWYRTLKVSALFEQAEAFWRDFAAPMRVDLPDARWGEALSAIRAHAAMAMNEGAPDVAVVNYNVFNRDGVYTTNILQKSGRFDLAAACIDYFLEHPFNGRVHPEADNPGQILWVMGEHWRFARDKAWLKRVYPQVQKLAALAQYYRTTPEPHWVALDSLDFGDALPAERRKRLKPGSCDGHHPEYTEAFDVAGLRGAGLLAEAAGEPGDAADWRTLADRLATAYDAQFGGRLPEGYGSYSVLWPCRLYPFGEGKGFEQFRGSGATKPGGWRYFALGHAHQGLLAGNRAAGHGTIANHLAHPQMKGWYLFDEGGKSGSGGWGHVRTTWNASVAMPHGWAVAELWLLLRDSLVHEDGNRLVLLGGVPPGWFTGSEPIVLEQVPTWFGRLSLTWTPRDGGATLKIGMAGPRGGFVLRLPPELRASIVADGKPVPARQDGDVLLPPDAKSVRVTFGK